MTARTYLLWALILSALSSCLFISFLVFSGFPEGTISPDGKGYVSVVEYLKGEDVVLDKFRISRPVIPLLVLPLSYVVGTQMAFLVVNAFLFVLLVGVFFVLTHRQLKESLHAFYATLLLIFAYPIYYRGINVTVDLGSWLIYVAMALVLVDRKQQGKLTVRISSQLAVICGISTLVTELAFASFLLVFIFYFLEQRRMQQPAVLIRDLFIIGTWFVIPVIIVQAAIYLIFDYSFVDKTQRQLRWFAENPENLGVMGLVRVLVGAFSVSLFFVLLGFFNFQERRQDTSLELAMLLSCLCTIVAVYTNSIRFIFVFFPLIFTYTVRGILFLVSKMKPVLSQSGFSTRLPEISLILAVCAWNVLLYIGFLQYGSTKAMARHLLPFLL